MTNMAVYAYRLTFTVVLLFGLCEAPSPAQTPPATSLPPEAVDRLLHDLASPRWAVREAASNALMDAGTAAYRPLRSSFMETSSYEVRRRIKQVAMEIYLAEHLGSPKAFLGISHLGPAAPDTGDERAAPWASGLLITDVIYGTGADRAGLRRGDLMMALNGRTGTKGYPAIEFTQWIASQKPGAVCLLNIIRGGEGVRLDDSVIPGFLPAAFSKARVRVVRHEDDPRVPYEAVGILLDDVGEMDWKMKKEDAKHVSKGDLLLALNDEPIPHEGSMEHFQHWCSGQLPKKASELPPAQGARNISAPPRASVHLLRGGQGQDLEVTLGRRPANLDFDRRGARGEEASPREQALASFSTWWQSTFDPQGLLSDSADEDPRWELEPR